MYLFINYPTCRMKYIIILLIIKLQKPDYFSHYHLKYSSVVDKHIVRKFASLVLNCIIIVILLFLAQNA